MMLKLLLTVTALLAAGSKSTNVRPSSDFHHQLCASSEAEVAAAIQESLGGFNPGAVKQRVEGTLQCKRTLCVPNGDNPPRPQRGVPDYILALAPKCGSSSFHNLLQAHPGIASSQRKVLPFFVTHLNEVLERCPGGAPGWSAPIHLPFAIFPRPIPPSRTPCFG